MSKTNLKPLFSSAKDDWETPDDFFQAMEKLFGKFDFDAACNTSNAKCDLGLRKDAGNDALKTKWAIVDGRSTRVWLNPPYGRGITGKWVQKAYEESLKGVKTVLLLPARTDTKWYKICHQNASEIYFVQGRLKFKGAKDSAPFPSMVVVFEQHGYDSPFFYMMNTKGEVIS